MKKRWTAFALFLCLLFSTAHAAKITQVLTFAWWGDGQIPTATVAGIDGFTAAQRQRVLVQSRSLHTREEYADWLAEQMASGWPGDVLELDAEMLRTLAKTPQGEFQLVDLETHRKLLDLKQFSYLGLSAGIVDGQLCAVPMSLSAHLFFWNSAALALRHAAAPADGNALARLAALVSAEDIYPLAADAESRMVLAITYLQSRYGQPWLDEENLRVSFTPAQVAEGLEYLSELEKQHILPPLATQGDITEGWRQGKYLGVWTWDYQGAFLSALLPEASAEGPPPLTVVCRLADWGSFSGGFQKPTRMLAISAASASPETGAKMIEYLLNSKRGARALLDSRGVPSSESALSACKTGNRISATAIEQNQFALTNSRYPMPLGFEAIPLTRSGGIYEQVLLGISNGDFTAEAAAEFLITEIATVLQQP